jgi:hypothetical protein
VAVAITALEKGTHVTLEGVDLILIRTFRGHKFALRDIAAGKRS